MPLLAIETTCDETAAAVIDRARRVLSSVVASQESLHAAWRGVVPELAARAHVERIVPVIDEAVSRAGVSRGAIEAVAVAVRPGLVGSLLVGVAAAKGVAAALGCPLVGYDHVAAHLYACRIAHGDRAVWPAVGLVASGGHTSLFHVRSPLDLERLGGTIDDAAGEAFDKAAALLGLGYPGGPAVERAATGGDPRAHRFPRPLAGDRDRLDMSFSGLKTALRYRIRPPWRPGGSASARGARPGRSRRVLPAGGRRHDPRQGGPGARAHRMPCAHGGGGVAANTLLREALEDLGRRRRVAVLVPPRELCTDNAAMGAIAWERLERGENDGLELDITPGTDRRRADAPPPGGKRP